MYHRIIKDIILSSCEGLYKIRLAPHEIELSRPPAGQQGDVATTIAFILAKNLKKSPRDIAHAMADNLKSHALLKEVSCAGAGFINITMEPSFWGEQLKKAAAQKETWSKINLGKNEKVNVEYVSANPTGPLHIGHARGAVVGDAVANILEYVGFDVTREYYVNDAGGQIDLLVKSIQWHYEQCRGTQQKPLPDDYYQGAYIKDLAQDLCDHHQEQPADLRSYAVKQMLALIKRDLALLGIRHDVFFSEYEMVTQGALVAMVQRLEKAGMLYKGTLPPPKGKKTTDWQAREQLLFRSSRFGDDIDRAINKEDGTPTYFASDICYHEDKLKRGARRLINIWGRDHAGYVMRLTAALAFLDKDASLEILLTAMVRLKEDGKVVTLSKRAGVMTTMSDLIDKVGRDAVRFIMLMRRCDAPLDFDMTLATQAVRENPVFYVHYAHARCASVLRLANETLSSHILREKKHDFLYLTSPPEIALIKEILRFSHILEEAANHLEPHRLPYYLIDLAESFHQLWNMGKKDEAMRFLNQDNLDILKARLGLIEMTKGVLHRGLALLGIEARDELRSDAEAG